MAKKIRLWSFCLYWKIHFFPSFFEIPPPFDATFLRQKLSVPGSDLCRRTNLKSHPFVSKFRSKNDTLCEPFFLPSSYLIIQHQNVNYFTPFILFAHQYSSQNVENFRCTGPYTVPLDRILKTLQRYLSLVPQRGTS